MTETSFDIIAETVAKFNKDPMRLMDIARDVQDRLGCVCEETIGEIARALDIERVQVRDMVSFFAFLSRKPQGKSVIRLCNSVVDRMFGAQAVASAFEEALGISVGGTTDDGAATLLHTPCIGLSDQPPSALVDGVPFTNLKPGDAGPIVEAIRRGENPADLPQAGAHVSVNRRDEVVFAPYLRGAALRAAVGISPEEVIREISKSRLRGHGGAGFPTAMKWSACRNAPGETRYLICNADEGEPGTFKDRAILSETPDLLFEGMAVAAYALGAQRGILYLRAEYEYLREPLERVLAKRRHVGLLGRNICGCEGFHFDIRIQMGAGAYVCGEESALIESAEGKRGAPRDRPPFPVRKGYKQEPTSVNNVMTLACVARIVEKGGEWFSKIGTKDSTGTKLLSVSGDCSRPGVYEVPYGISLAKVLDMVGADHPQAVQMSGPSGMCIAPKDFGRSISFEDLPTGGSVIVIGRERDLLGCMREFTEFFAEESCGWCAPCRVGVTDLGLKFEKILEGKGTRDELEDLERLGLTVKTMSRCGLGQTAANPILTSMRNFPDLYEDLLRAEPFVPAFDMNEALREAREIAGREAELEESHS